MAFLLKGQSHGQCQAACGTISRLSFERDNITGNVMLPEGKSHGLCHLRDNLTAVLLKEQFHGHFHVTLLKGQSNSCLSKGTISRAMSSCLRVNLTAVLLKEQFHSHCHVAFLKEQSNSCPSKGTISRSMSCCLRDNLMDNVMLPEGQSHGCPSKGIISRPLSY